MTHAEAANCLVLLWGGMMVACGVYILWYALSGAKTKTDATARDR